MQLVTVCIFFFFLLSDTVISLSHLWRLERILPLTLTPSPHPSPRVCEHTAVGVDSQPSTPFPHPPPLRRRLISPRRF